MLLSKYFSSATALAKGSIEETRKMIWPRKNEVLNASLFIGGLVAVLAVVIWGADKGLEYAIYDLMLNFKK